MKIQDILFVIIFFGLFFVKFPHKYVFTGLLCFIFAIPLFASWTFFTAERLTWYGAAFVLAETVGLLFTNRKDLT